MKAYHRYEIRENILKKIDQSRLDKLRANDLANKAPEDPIPAPSDITDSQYNEWLSIDENVQTSATITAMDVCSRCVDMALPENTDQFHLHYKCH